MRGKRGSRRREEGREEDQEVMEVRGDDSSYGTKRKTVRRARGGPKSSACRLGVLPGLEAEVQSSQANGQGACSCIACMRSSVGDAHKRAGLEEKHIMHWCSLDLGKKTVMGDKSDG